MEYTGYRFFAARFHLGIGIYFMFMENELMPTKDENGLVESALFDGLVLFLPFCELRFGTAWYPSPTSQKD